ncbi:MAG: acyltransferase [Pseudomonadota bacterium]
MKQLQSVQALRGVAALLVFMGHLIALEKIHAGRETSLTEFWASGIFGVDLFFVISGFVIVWVGADLPQTWAAARRFSVARIVRIYPVWWVFAGTAAIAYWLTNGAPWNVERIGEFGREHLLHSFLLWPQPTPPVLSVGWTLTHEMYFYLGFAVLVFAVPVRHRAIAFSAWGGAVFVGALLGLSSGFAGSLVELIFYPMTLEFMAGGGVAFAIKSGLRRAAWLSLTLGGSGFLAGFLSADALTIGVPNLALEWQRTLVFGASSALIVYGAVALELQDRLPRLLVPSTLVAIGNWSYALYLCHVLTISLSGRLVYSWLDPTQSLSVGMFSLTSIALSLGVAAATYHALERPVITAFKCRRAS